MAFGSLARALGPLRPGPLARAAPALVAAVSDGHRAVRSSALAASAALVHGIGMHAVQLLPQLAPAILRAAASALTLVAAENGEEGTQASPVSPGSRDRRGQGKQGAGHKRTGESGARAEAAALEVAAALAAVLALLRALPKFVSPYLPAILQHTLTPVVRALPTSSVYPNELTAPVREQF